MAQTFDDNLRIIEESGIDPRILPFSENLNIIQALDDEPNDVGGLTAAELKAKFDEAGLKTQKYINESLIPQLLADEATEADRKAAEEDRGAEELLRAAAEQVRVSAETERSGAEGQRATAESQRVSAEQGRAAAEEARETEEEERDAAEGVRSSAEQARVAAESARAAAELARAAGEVRRDAQMETILGRTVDAIDAAERVETVEAAIHSRRRVLVGTATDVEKLMPGDELIIVDDSSAVSAVDYQDLLLEAQKAAAGATNSLETMAVLSVVNATNLRRTAEGLLWTTDTLADFRAKLTAFAAAAVAGGYADEDGVCVATWSQAQAWLLEGTLLTPIAAEVKEYDWRRAEPKTEYDAIKERMGAIEAMLGQFTGNVNTMITGGTRT